MTEAVAAREITLRRVYDAPRELVWKAWTEPDRLVQWWGKRGWNAQRSTVVLDVRPGGRFSLIAINEEDGREMPSDFVFREVVEPERLVLAEPAGEGCPENEGAVSTITFTDLGDGRTEMVMHSRVHTTAENRDNAEGGLTSAFERLAEHLAS